MASIAFDETLETIVTDTIWFGKMDNIDDRVDLADPANEKAAYFQSAANIRLRYDRLKDCSKVRGKKSLRQVVGI